MSPHHASNRHGLTLIELIVVLAIVILLGVLLVPVLQNARERARQSQCRNNLKQLGLAFHNYHDTFNRFPPGFVLGDNGVYHGWGWGVMITPYLDASPYYSQLTFGPGLQNEFRKKSVNPIYQLYRCPSDPGSSYLEHASIVTTNVRHWRVTPGTVDATETFSRTNYFGVAGFLHATSGGIVFDDPTVISATDPQINAGSLGQHGWSAFIEQGYCDPRNFGGIFGQNSSIRLKDIVDGTSTTLMAGERYTPRHAGLGSIGHGTWVGVPDCTSAAGLAMSLGDTSTPPNRGSRYLSETTGFGSRHGPGTHFLWADGSVRMMSDKINVSSYRKASSLADPYEGSDF